MYIDIVSDLHIEMNRKWAFNDDYDKQSELYPWHWEKRSDILLVVGDCANHPDTTIEMITEARQFYDHVIFTDGNHEHYIGAYNKDLTVGYNSNELQMFANRIDGVEYLNGTGWFHDGVLFIGANGWYDWTAHSWTSRNEQHAAWKRDSNDSRCIRFDPDGYPDKLAQQQADRLRQLVIDAQADDEIKQIVVITHTIPHRGGMVPDNHPWGYLNGSYFNSLMESVWMADVNEKIVMWGFGHTHYPYDFVDHGIRFINNARGYATEERPSGPYKGLMQIDLDGDLNRSAFGIIDESVSE